MFSAGQLCIATYCFVYFRGLHYQFSQQCVLIRKILYLIFPYSLPLLPHNRTTCFSQLHYRLQLHWRIKYTISKANLISFKGLPLAVLRPTNWVLYYMEAELYRTINRQGKTFHSLVQNWTVTCSCLHKNPRASMQVAQLRRGNIPPLYVQSASLSFLFLFFFFLSLSFFAPSSWSDIWDSCHSGRNNGSAYRHKMMERILFGFTWTWHKQSSLPRIIKRHQ